MNDVISITKGRTLKSTMEWKLTLDEEESLRLYRPRIGGWTMVFIMQLNEKNVGLRF